jgi:uncharacterized membrane protein
MSSVWLRDFQDKIRATYWYLPLLMSLLGAILAVVLYWISQMLPSSLPLNVIPSMTTADARGALAAIAETTIGVIGVVFSIMLVPLTIASSQYGSVIMRSFMRDRATQIVLGAYGAATFYSLILMTILPAGATILLIHAQVPVWISFCMLLLDLVILFYFIHHVAESLQAATVIEQISKELEEVIKDYPLAKAMDSFDSRQDEVHVLRDTLLREGKAITSDGEGYVRAIDYGKLMRIAVECKSVLYLRRQSGDFVSRGDRLLLAWPGLESAISNVNRAYFLGGNRTLYQDAEYGIYIIVTIAVRALSPAINDPVTPVMCLNRIGAALGMLAERISPSPYFCDNDNQLRIISDPVSFERLVGVAFNMIREYGRGNAEVLMKMLETIGMISTHASSEAQRTVLVKHATLIEHDSHIGLPSDYDKQRVHDVYEEILRAINQTNSGVTADRM